MHDVAWALDAWPQLKEMMPEFRQEAFVEHIAENLAPAVVTAYLKGDLDTLRATCREQAYAMLASSVNERITTQLLMDQRILHMSVRLPPPAAARPPASPQGRAWRWRACPTLVREPARRRSTALRISSSKACVSSVGCRLRSLPSRLINSTAFATPRRGRLSKATRTTFAPSTTSEHAARRRVPSGAASRALAASLCPTP